MTDLTLTALAEQTGVHVETLRRLARSGRLPGAYQIGSRWRISTDAAALFRKTPTLPPENENRPQRTVGGIDT